ncbi:MAG: hypothetical protein ABIR19_02205, partial [Ginsengibacter sp.]
LSTKASQSLKDSLNELNKKMIALGSGDSSGSINFNLLYGSFTTMFEVLQEADVAPTSESVATIKDLEAKLDDIKKKMGENTGAENSKDNNALE